MERNYPKELTDLVKQDCFIILNQLKNLCSELEIPENLEFEHITSIKIEVMEIVNKLIPKFLSELDLEKLRLRTILCVKHTKQNMEKVESPYFHFLRNGFGTAINVYLRLYLININLNKNNFKIKESFLRKIPLSSIEDIPNNENLVSLQKPSNIDNFRDDYIPFLNDKMFVFSNGRCPIIGHFEGFCFSHFSYEFFFLIFEEIISKNFGEKIQIFKEKINELNPSLIKRIPVFYRFFLGLIPFNKEHLEKYKKVFEKI